MAPDLLERQAELRALGVAVERATAGHGSTALILGEAGIGKTSLIQAFLAATQQRARVLAGGCEDLLTPRALGPLRDATRASSGPLARALAGGAEPDLVLSAVRDELAASPSPTVLIIDDAHWADGATLDVMRFLGRRMADLPALLVVAYRDDVVDSVHPLRSVLGGLTGANTIRLHLAPLTAQAVDELAGTTDVDTGELFRLTAGNPFYLTEVLATPDADVPPTVIDAVLARVAKLSAEARAAIERLAVVPSRVELDLLRVLQQDLAPIGEAERAGVLIMRREVIAFRHELARRTVAASLPVSVRVRLHGDVLDALLAQRMPDPFRVLHHAVQRATATRSSNTARSPHASPVGPGRIAKRPRATPRSSNAPIGCRSPSGRRWARRTHGRCPTATSSRRPRPQPPRRSGCGSRLVPKPSSYARSPPSPGSCG